MADAQNNKQAQDRPVTESTVNVSSKTVAETLLTQAGPSGSETAAQASTTNNVPNPVSTPSSASASASSAPSGSDAAPKSLSSGHDQGGGVGLATGHAIAIGLGVSALCTLAIIAVLIIRKKRERQKKQAPNRFTRSDSYLDQMKSVSDAPSIDYNDVRPYSAERPPSWPDAGQDPLADHKLDKDATPLPKTHMPQRRSSTSTISQSEAGAVRNQHSRNPSMVSMGSTVSTVVPLRFNKSPFSDDKAVKSGNDTAPEELELPVPPKPTHASKASLASSVKTSTTSWYSEYTRKDALSVDMTNAKTMSSVNPFYYDSV
jgi:hypothetical protein